MNPDIPNTDAVRQYLTGLQERIVTALEALDGAPFRTDSWQRPEGGGGVSRLIEDGRLFERGVVNFSYVTGTTLPPSASAHRSFPTAAHECARRDACRLVHA